MTRTMADSSPIGMHWPANKHHDKRALAVSPDVERRSRKTIGEVKEELKEQLDQMPAFAALPPREDSPAALKRQADITAVKLEKAEFVRKKLAVLDGRGVHAGDTMERPSTATRLVSGNESQQAPLADPTRPYSAPSVKREQKLDDQAENVKAMSLDERASWVRHGSKTSEEEARQCGLNLSSLSPEQRLAGEAEMLKNMSPQQRREWARAGVFGLQGNLRNPAKRTTTHGLSETSAVKVYPTTEHKEEDTLGAEDWKAFAAQDAVAIEAAQHLTAVALASGAVGAAIASSAIAEALEAFIAANQVDLQAQEVKAEAMPPTVSSSDDPAFVADTDVVSTALQARQTPIDCRAGALAEKMERFHGASSEAAEKAAQDAQAGKAASCKHKSQEQEEAKRETVATVAAGAAERDQTSEPAWASAQGVEDAAVALSQSGVSYRLGVCGTRMASEQQEGEAMLVVQQCSKEETSKMPLELSLLSRFIDQYTELTGKALAGLLAGDKRSGKGFKTKTCQVYLNLRENKRGKFLKLATVHGQGRKTITVPEELWTSFLEALRMVQTIEPVSHEPWGPEEVRVQAPKPEAGFHYHYVIRFPASCAVKAVPLAVECNNNPFAMTEADFLEDVATNAILGDFQLGAYIGQRFNCPVLMPVFPRCNESNLGLGNSESDSDGSHGSSSGSSDRSQGSLSQDSREGLEDYVFCHQLDSATIQYAPSEKEKRIDLQLLAMIDDARSMLQRCGVSTHPRILSVGFSSSAVFATRFSFLHYPRVLATVAGGIGGLVPVPESCIDGVVLNYPLGTNDYFAITGREFDVKGWNQVAHLYITGSKDDSCPFYFGGEDLTDEEACSVKKVFAKGNRGFRDGPIKLKVLRILWQNTLAYLRGAGAVFEEATMPGIGHDLTTEGLAAVDAFLLRALPP